MIEKFDSIKEKYKNLEKQLSDPKLVSDHKKFASVSREHSNMTPVIEKFTEFKSCTDQLEESKNIVDSSNDDELIEMAREEIAELEPKISEIEEELKMLLLPKDPDDDKNCIMEIRAGTGGEEAALFAADIYRMYVKYIEKKKWRMDEMSVTPSDVGGFKEIIFMINGTSAYGNLKYESGVHRVQRVPATETSGRLHTSAATVAVLPEAEDVDIQIDEKDIKIDVYRSSGPGGQSVNTTDSAVRITHIPTGMVVTCQDEKSQHKNRSKALKVLSARLLDKIRSEEQAKIARERKTQVGSGDRSAKIRTYNFPQRRVTDHRINFSLYNLQEFLEGDIEEFIEKLSLAEKTAKLQEL